MGQIDLIFTLLKLNIFPVEVNQLVVQQLAFFSRTFADVHQDPSNCISEILRSSQSNDTNDQQVVRGTRIAIDSPALDESSGLRFVDGQCCLRCFMNRQLRTRMMGGVGTGRENLPVTRLYCGNCDRFSLQPAASAITQFLMIVVQIFGMIAKFDW
jgi:hypothetical protein